MVSYYKMPAVRSVHIVQLTRKISCLPYNTCVAEYQFECWVGWVNSTIKQAADCIISAHHGMLTATTTKPNCMTYRRLQLSQCCCDRYTILQNNVGMHIHCMRILNIKHGSNFTYVLNSHSLLVDHIVHKYCTAWMTTTMCTECGDVMPNVATVNFRTVISIFSKHQKSLQYWSRCYL